MNIRYQQRSKEAGSFKTGGVAAKVRVDEDIWETIRAKGYYSNAFDCIDYVGGARLLREDPATPCDTRWSTRLVSVCCPKFAGWKAAPRSCSKGKSWRDVEQGEVLGYADLEDAIGYYFSKHDRAFAVTISK